MMDKIQVFFSYAHADHTLSSVTRTSWLSELFQLLFDDLKARDKRSPYRVLLDRDGAIRYGDDIDTSVAQAVETCDIALLFLSPSYARSPNCADEVKQLLAAGKDVIPVEIERDWKGAYGSAILEHLPALSGLKRFSFFDENDPTGPRLGFPEPSKLIGDDFNKFREQVWTLANTIKNKTREVLDARQSAPAARPASMQVDQTDICLAAPVSDARMETDRLEKALVAAGVTVHRLDLSNAQIAQDHTALTRAVGQSNLFVQVVGGLPGPERFAGTGWTSSRAQHEAALAAEVEAHIWRLPGLDPSDFGSAHRDFLDNATTHASSFEDFEKFILNQVETHRARIEAEEEREDRAQGQSAPIFFAIDVSKDERHLGHLIDEALRNHGLLSGSWIEETPDQRQFEDAVMQNDAVVLVYGEDRGGQNRARSHFVYFQKAIFKAKRAAFRVAVGDGAPPPPKAPPAPGGKGVHVIRVKDAVDSKALAKFVASLSPAAMETA